MLFLFLSLSLSLVQRGGGGVRKKKYPNILLTIRKSRLKYATFTTNHRRPCLQLTQISHPRRNEPTNEPKPRLVAFSMALRIGREERERERDSVE